MNKFIEALKEAGIYDRIVKTIVNVRKRNDVKDTKKRNNNYSENRNE